MTKYRLIINPTSGRGKGLESIPAIQNQMRQLHLDFEMVQTERPWHAAELASQAAQEGIDVVVSVGGDGTANEVLNGLIIAHRDYQVPPGKTAMGVLCVGRGNDFAYGMNIPAEFSAGCQVLAEGYRRKIDVGFVQGGDYPQGRYFGNGVGIGFDAVVGFEALKMKRLSGFPSYIVAALKTLFLYYRAPRVEIRINDEIQQFSALMISIMNGRRMGGGFMMAPEALQDDGLLDICIAQQASRPRVLALIPHFLKGTQATQPEISSARTRALSVRAIEGTLPVHADGETICTNGQELNLELHSQQVEIVCQQR